MRTSIQANQYCGQSVLLPNKIQPVSNSRIPWAVRATNRASTPDQFSFKLGFTLSKYQPYAPILRSSPVCFLSGQDNAEGDNKVSSWNWKSFEDMMGNMEEILHETRKLIEDTIDENEGSGKDSEDNLNDHHNKQLKKMEASIKELRGSVNKLQTCLQNDVVPTLKNNTEGQQRNQREIIEQMKVSSESQHQGLKSLEDILTNLNHKGSLWKCLKKMLKGFKGKTIEEMVGKLIREQNYVTGEGSSKNGREDGHASAALLDENMDSSLVTIGYIIFAILIASFAFGVSDD